MHSGTIAFFICVKKPALIQNLNLLIIFFIKCSSYLVLKPFRHEYTPLFEIIHQASGKEALTRVYVIMGCHDTRRKEECVG